MVPAISIFLLGSFSVRASVMVTERKGYGFDAERYRNWSKHQKEWGVRLISQMTLRGDEGVIDLGCGDGLLTTKIAELVPDGQVLGVDASSSMIEVATGQEGGNLRFEVLDINHLSFVESFDVAFSNAALHWVTDHRTLLRSIHRALRPGGHIYLNFAAAGNCSNLFRIEKEEMASPRFRSYFEDFEWPWFMPVVAEYAGLVEEAGFLEHWITGQVADRHFTQEELVNWIEQPSIVPLLEHLKLPEVREHFRKRVVGRMIEETGQADGSYFETFRRINVIAARR
jgi:trans-aconitate methyltransferase